MKKSELQKIIREEVRKVLKEGKLVQLRSNLIAYPKSYSSATPSKKIEIPRGESIEIIEHPFEKQPNDSLIKYKGQEYVVVRSSLDRVVGPLKETYYNPEWKLTTVQSWLDGYAKKNNIPFKLIHKTDKNSTIGRHAKTNTYYVYDIGDKYGIVVRNEKVPGAPRLDQLYVIAGPKGSTLGSLVGASTLTDASEQELHKFLDKILK